MPYWAQLIVGVGVTTASWVLVAFFGPKTSMETLVSFYATIQPGGKGWNPVVAQLPKSEATTKSDLPAALLASLFGAVCIYSALFTTGYVLYGQHTAAVVVLGLCLISGFGLWKVWPRIKFD